MEILSTEDFYSQAHRYTFEMMEFLSEKGRVIDLRNAFRGACQSPACWRNPAAPPISPRSRDGVPIGTMAGMAEYCRIVKEKSTIRRLITASENVISTCFAGTEDSDKLIDLAQSAVFEILRKVRADRDSSPSATS